MPGNVSARVGIELWRPVASRTSGSSIVRSLLNQRLYGRLTHTYKTSSRDINQRAVQQVQGSWSARRTSFGPISHKYPNLQHVPGLGAYNRWEALASPRLATRIRTLATQALDLELRYKTRLQVVARGIRNKSSESQAKDEALSSSTAPRPEGNRVPSSAAEIENLQSLSKSAPAAKSIWDNLPQLPQNIHRPSRDDLLSAATGFWSRLRARFKWFTIRSDRRFNIDEITALFSWIVLGHFVWILVGTTTFFSLAILVINTVFAQETLAQWVGNYLTQASGLKVVFESAVVPKWKDGTIQFKKVFISRRPGQGKSKVSKGSQAEAAAAAANAALADRVNGNDEEEEDTNYTQFDVSLDTINVTLSFAKYFNGKGWIKDVEISGVRGVIDRTSVHWTGEPVDPKSYRKEHEYGDFELDSFKMSDLLVTLYQPKNFRPFTISIYQCDLPQLRKQWLFYDFLSANTISGSFDNSLFTIHPRQTHSHTGLQLEEGAQWKKHSRIRLDGLNIDHLNRGVEGPFSWIHEGNVDIVADILLPNDDDDSIAKVMSDFYDRMEATVTAPSSFISLNSTETNVEKAKDAGTGQLDAQNIETAAQVTQTTDEDAQRFLIMDLRVHLNDVRATVPLFTSDITYINNALIRPIVAYINSKRSFIPVNCRVVKPVSDFDGSWTVYDSGLMDDLSQEMYEAFARDVINDKDNRKRRFRKVGVWTLQLAAQALFLGLAGNVA